LDAATLAVTADIPIGGDTNAPAVTVSPDGRNAYITNEVGSAVVVIDTADGYG
jgi:DNA-binding beta-propeller fold protein YncE